jgi:hypothetical protein
VKRLIAAVVVVLSALTASGCATAGASTTAVRDRPQQLNGVYRTRVVSGFQSGALNGVWRLRFANPAYTLNYTGMTSKNVIIAGVYTVSASRITFRDHGGACSAKRGSGGCQFLGCRHPATYTFTLAGNKLTFSRLRDPNTDCELPVVLAGEFYRVR